MGGLDPWRRRQDAPKSRTIYRETTQTSQRENQMAQPKKLTPENLDKELAAIKERQSAAEEMRADAWKKLDEAENAKLNLQRQAILIETAKNMLGEPIKAQLAYAKGLAEGRGIVFTDDPEASLLELLSQFKAQDTEVATESTAAAKRGRPPKVEKTETPVEQPEKPKRKRRTKAEMEAARAAEAAEKAAKADAKADTSKTVIPDISPAAAAAALVEPVLDDDYFDDGDYDD